MAPPAGREGRDARRVRLPGLVTRRPGPVTLHSLQPRNGATRSQPVPCPGTAESRRRILCGLSPKDWAGMIPPVSWGSR
ncbi:hypothetical protein P7K49_004152, partial [Saguinus oedipus]